MIWNLLLRILLVLDELLERLDDTVTRGVSRVWGTRGTSAARAE